MASPRLLLISLLLLYPALTAQFLKPQQTSLPPMLGPNASQLGLINWVKSLFQKEQKQPDPSSVTTTSSLVYNVVYNFLDGLEFHQKISTSQSCFDSSGQLTNKIQVALQEFQQQNYFTAYFNATQSLEHASNVTRHCYLTVDDTVNSLSSYIANFNNFGDYLTQVQEEILPKFAPISVAYANLQDSFQNKQWEEVARHTGSIVKIIFHITPPSLLLSPPAPSNLSTLPIQVEEEQPRLRSTPLVQNSFTNMINVFTSFIFRSGAVENENNINSCQNALIDMNNKWYEISLKLQEQGDSIFQEAVFLFADSLTLIHPVSWYCYFVGNGAYQSFSSKISGQLSYEAFAMNVFFNQLYIRNGYENIKSCVQNSNGIQFDCIGEQLGTIVQYMIFV